MQHFSPNQLKQHLINHQPILLDVREKWEFDICKIEGSILLPMHQIPNNINQFEKDQSIVLICHHGIRSRQVGIFLESHGFTDLINLTGGVDLWAKDIDPTMSKY